MIGDTTLIINLTRLTTIWTFFPRWVQIIQIWWHRLVIQILKILRFSPHQQSFLWLSTKKKRMPILLQVTLPLFTSLTLFATPHIWTWTCTMILSWWKIGKLFPESLSELCTHATLGPVDSMFINCGKLVFLSTLKTLGTTWIGPTSSLGIAI